MNMPLVVIDAEQPTLDDVIAALRANAGLTERRRRDLISAVRSTARLLNRNAPEIEADMAHLRERLGAIHPVQAGISAKRLANIKADLAHALRVARAAPRRPRRAHRTPEWDAFFAALEKPWQRYSLARFATFCSRCGISPADVDEHTIGRFRAYLAEASLAKDPDKTIKITIQTWNGIIARFGLPYQHLTPVRSDRYRTRPLSEYPKSFQDDIEAWLRRQASADLWADDGPVKPLRPVSLRNIRASIRQFAAALVARGHAVEDIRGLATLVEIENFKEGFRFYIERNGGERPTWLTVMAATLLAIAKYHVQAPSKQIEALRTFKGRLKVDRPGLTEKNKARLGQFDDPRNVERLLNLPRLLVDRAARSKRESSRVALDVMYAVAIEILLACPMRIGNLSGLDIERHFSRRGTGNAQILSLAIPGAEVKNEQPIEADLPRDTTRLVRTYMRSYRHLVSDDPGDWLFPARFGGSRLATHLSANIAKVIYRETGLIMNAHLFRHLAGMLYLQRHPGSYELVRRILGHKKMATTLSFYTDLESKWALRRYDEAVLSRRGKA